MIRDILACILVHVLHSSSQSLLPLPSSFLEKTAWALPGGQGYLPCEIEAENQNEQLYTVLWYKGEDGEPIYTFDARSSAELEPHNHHWSEEEPRGLGSRASLVTSPHPAQLVIVGVKESDAGVYRCRVDFKTSQTRNSFVTLAIIQPPLVVNITHNNVLVEGSIGPVNEGESLTMLCQAKGSPPPTLTWYRNNILVDASSELLPQNTVQNTINIHSLGEREINTKFTCKASNNNQTKFAQKTVEIKINFAPREVKILDLPASVSAGKSQTIKCSAVGSVPAAAITWWKDGQFLQRPLEGFSENKSFSTLEIIFTNEDNGKVLSCRAENTLIPGSTIEAKTQLDIRFSPRVGLIYGANINPESVGEGQDIYFECICTANPPVYKIVWLHNGYKVDRNGHTVISGHSLVIQGVTRHHSGNYSCIASNSEGDAVSEVLLLQVRYPPTCSFQSEKRIFLPLSVDAEVVCKVESHPVPTDWWWTFNNSHQMDQVPTDKFFNNLTTSTLRYTPLTLQDYGILNCWATNSQGRMEEPCTFNIARSSATSRPLECTLQNQTGSSLLVLCSGFLEKNHMFHLEVRDKSSGELVQNLTSGTPRFIVTDLPPANWLSGLNLTVYTASREGTINTVETLGVFTSKVAELQIESVEVTDVPLSGLGIGCGIVLTLLLLFLSLVIAVFTRNSQDNGNSDIYDQGHHHHTTQDQAYTVYDKVDLLSPVQNNMFIQEFKDTSDTSELHEKKSIEPQQHQPAACIKKYKILETMITDRGCNITEGTHHSQQQEYKTEKNSSADSLSCLLSDVHQESVL